MKVQSYESNVGIEATPGVQIDPSSVGENNWASTIGKGLGAVADASFRVKMHQKQELEQLQEEENRLYAMNSLSQFRQRRLGHFETEKDRSQPGAEGFAGAQNEAFEADLKGVLETAPNRRTRVLMEQGAREFQNTFFSHAMGFEVTERQRFRMQSHVDGAKAESNEISSSPNPMAAYMSLVPQRLELIQSMSADPSARQKILDAVTLHNSKTLVMADAKTDPKLTLDRIDNGIYAKLPGWNLYGDQLDTMRRGVEALVNKQDHSMTAAIKDAMVEWKAQLLRGQVNPATGEVPIPKFNIPDEAVEKAIGPVAFANWKEEREWLPIAHSYGAMIPLSSDQYASAAMKRVRDDIASGKISAKYGSSIEEYIGKQIATVMEQRKKDPAQAAADAAVTVFGEAYTTAGKGDQLAMRDAMQFQFGISSHNRRLFTNEEAKGYADEISKMPADQAQQFMRNLPSQFETKNAYNIQGAQGSVTGKDMYSRAMGELFKYGKLDKGYMFMDFTSDTKYGNYFAKAMKISSDETLTQGLTQTQVHDIKKAVDENTELRRFMSVMRMSAAQDGAEAASTLEHMVRRVAYLTSGDASNPDAASLVKSIVASVVTDQLTVNGTYYVPKRDYITGRVLDPSKVDKQLKDVGDSWMKFNGERFRPFVRSGQPTIQGSPYHQESTLNPREGSYAWLSTTDGTGVYRAVRVRGTAGSDLPGVYEPVVDAAGNRYVVQFKDLDETHKLVKNPSRVSVGKIK